MRLYSYTREQRRSVRIWLASHLPRNRVSEAMELIGEHGKQGALDIVLARIERAKALAAGKD